MSIFMLVGIFGTLISKEPKIKREKNLKNHHHARFFLTVVISVACFIYSYSKLNNPFSEDQILFGFIFAISRIVFCFIIVFAIIYFFTLINIVSTKSIKKSYLNPITNFLSRYGKLAFFILLLISLYRIADVVMGVMANIFYLEKGFNVKEIATYSKFFGVFATILGGFLGGFFALRFGTMKALFLGALIAASSNLLFAWLAISEANINILITVITADNISSGFAGAAFVVYLSGLTSVKFTATQYALFSSLMLFIPKFIAGYSGSWVDVVGYANFFCITALLGVPVLLLIIWLAKVAPIKN